jgi:hypothetical protein
MARRDQRAGPSFFLERTIYYFIARESSVEHRAPIAAPHSKLAGNNRSQQSQGEATSQPQES